MNKIDTTNWKEFKIVEMFKVIRPSARSQANYDDGDVAFVASGNFNNGVLKYLKPRENELLDKGNCITVSPIDGSTFYQKDDFLGRGGAGSSVILLYNDNLNLYNGYFIATVIRSVCSKYAYSDMANKDTIGNEKIKLPVDKTGNPDFSYMETYMKNLEVAVGSSLTALQSANNSKNCNIVNASKWKEFKIEQLFCAYLSKDDIQPKNILDGDVPLISSGKEKNGIVAYISNNDAKLWESDTITVDMFGKAFHQEKPYFCVSHGRVNILVPKNKIGKYSLKFIATAIEKVASQKYEFKEMCTGTKLLRNVIKLPINKEGTIDYEYMENYMKNVEARIKTSISCFKMS